MPDPRITQYRPGLTAFTTPKGIRVVVLRLGADPADTPEWINNARRLYASNKDWRREMEGDWSSPAGKAYFPAFVENGGRDFYVHTATKLIRGPVFRSYDTGRRRPACTFFQYSLKQDRLFLLREFMPHDLQTHEFRDAVRWVSGEPEAPDEETAEAMRRRGEVWGAYHLVPRAQAWIEQYRSRPSGAHCPPPWFPVGTRFIDVGGKEIMQKGAAAQRSDEASFAQILAAAGMPMLCVSPDVRGRNRVVDRMLMVADDGWPRTFIDPQCEEMIAGFEGAFCYPEATAGTPVPDKPKKDGHYENLLDAWGYGVVAVCPLEGAAPEEQKRLIGYKGREEIYAVLDRDVEQIQWNEMRYGR